MVHSNYVARVSTRRRFYSQATQRWARNSSKTRRMVHPVAFSEDVSVILRLGQTEPIPERILKQRFHIVELIFRFDRAGERCRHREGAARGNNTTLPRSGADSPRLRGSESAGDILRAQILGSPDSEAARRRGVTRRIPPKNPPTPDCDCGPRPSSSRVPCG